MSITAMEQALEALEKISKTKYYIETPPIESLEEKMRRIADNAITVLRQAIEQAEKPEVLQHKHEWFRTGEMEVGQYRCISCGKWAKENT
jgi:hypothetical protein